MTTPDSGPDPFIPLRPSVGPTLSAPTERLVRESVSPDPSPAAPRPTARAVRAKRRSGPLRILSGLFGAIAAVVVIAGLAGAAMAWHTYQRYAADVPDIDTLHNYKPRVMSRVYAGDERLIAELATERRIFVPITAIPEMIQQAFISAEDQNFWSHRGVDPMAIARAAWTDIQLYGKGRRPIGASTITQQVARNMLLSNEVSIARKVKEFVLAIRIDQAMPKEKVLELYLNEIYLGLQAYGVASAAQAYFNKALDDITLPEAAFLAALPKAPNNYNPFRFPEAARARRDLVLDRMLEDRAITPEQAAAAKATPLTPSVFRRPETVPGSEWFAEEVRRQMIDKFGADTTLQAGYAIRTSLDPVLQAAADEALRKGLAAYDRTRGGWRGAVGRVEAGPGLKQEWSVRLAGQPKPPGMMSDWRLAVAIEVGADSAQMGWLERAPGQPFGTGTPKTGTLALSEAAWARPVRPNGLGPAPRRMADVLQSGDLVMVEILPAVPAQNKTPARPERLALRQVPQVQGALVSLDPATGRVLAMSGGWSFETSQFNRATQAQRQPGSSFKPIVYLTAMEAGLSPSQRVLDAPFVQNLGAAGQWRPNNYGLAFNGPTPIRVALEKSLNLVTVRLAEKVGMDAVAQNAIAFHVVDGMPKVLPAALGAVETTVLRQAAAYAALAMGGKEVLPTLVDTVQDRDGKVVWRPGGLECRGCDNPAAPPTLVDGRRQIADPQSVFQVVTMMQGVVQRGTGYAAGAGFKHPIAGKTGTSQDFNDAWFVGFTADLVTAVWIGFDDNTSLGDKETGGSVAAPIWKDFMTVALRTRPPLPFRMPEGMKMAAWDSGSGRVTDAFKPGQEPGASQGTIGGGEAPDDMASSGGPGVGIDSGMGGLY